MLPTGSIRNYTGYYINNVTTYPEWQGDPRNIIFTRTGSSHRLDTMAETGAHRHQEI